MRTTDIKENIKTVARFIADEQKRMISGEHFKHSMTWYFEQLEDKMLLPIADITSILELFYKAKIVNYKTYPWNKEHSLHVSPSPGEILRMTQKRSDLQVFPSFEMGTAIKDHYKRMEQYEATSEESKLVTNEKEVYIKDFEETIKSIEYRTTTNSKEIKTLEGLISSPNKLSMFLKKYSKYLNLPLQDTASELVVGNLRLNTTTGDFLYMKTKGNFTPKGQQYKLLSLLMTSPSYQSTYIKITARVFLSVDEPKTYTKSRIHQVVKKIKEKLEILPKTNKSNPDLIQNIEDLGYRIIVE